MREDVAARPIEPTDGLLVVVTSDEGKLSWLHAGEALSAVWLDATTEGLSVVPLSQVVEVAETRYRARGPARARHASTDPAPCRMAGDRSQRPSPHAPEIPGRRPPGGPPDWDQRLCASPADAGRLEATKGNRMRDRTAREADSPVEHPDVAELRRIIAVARRAPSVHNTQPWRWRIDGRVLELRADRSRQLRVADPVARNLTISCGCALHHAEVAASALGWRASVEMLPERADHDLLARLHLVPDEVPEDSHEVLRNIDERRTDRRRFTNWPVPPERLHDLAAEGSRWGADVFVLTDLTQRWRVEGLVDRATAAQDQDHRFAAEQQAWTDRGPTDGIPSTALADGVEHGAGLRTRFTPRLTPDDRPARSKAPTA